jgi:hypothetical protein
MAASLCAKHDCSPRDVYARHLDTLKALMSRGVGLQAAQRAPGMQPAKTH